MGVWRRAVGTVISSSVARTISVIVAGSFVGCKHHRPVETIRSGDRHTHAAAISSPCPPSPLVPWRGS
jgi:hypothetical protein